MSRISTTCMSTTVVVLACAAIALAGGLVPPVGPVFGTMKSLDEIEPRIAVNAANTPGDESRLFMITQPGSYYLTSDVDAGALTFAIQILVPDVTLDLNGFTVSGTGAIGINADGMPALENITLRNGAISGFHSMGVDFITTLNSRVENVTVVRTGELSPTPFGLAIYAPNALVVGCIASDNIGGGIFVPGSGGAVIDCVAARNGGRGIEVVNGLVSGCSAVGNGMGNIAALSGTTVVNTHAP